MASGQLSFITSSLAIASTHTDAIIHTKGTFPAARSDYTAAATATNDCRSKIVFTKLPASGVVLASGLPVKVFITAIDNINSSESVGFSVSTNNSAAAPSITINGPASVCAGALATFNAAPLNSTAPSYQWQVNGVNAGTDNATFSTSSLNDNDVVTCILTDNSGTTPVTSNAITIKINLPLVPTIKIAADKATQCAGAPVTFSATAGNAGTNPNYKWTVNDVDAGSNSATLTLASILPTDVVKCVVTSDSPCPASTESNTITNINTIDNLTPSLSIQSSVTSPVCNGTPIKFTASPVNEGANPTYQWQVNGANQGTNTPDFTISNFANGDVVTCMLTNNNSPCLTSPTALSNAITISVIPPSTLVPSVTIIPDLYEECTGVSLTFKAVATDAGDNPTYQWKINGQNVGINAGIFNSSSFKTGDKISCTVTSSALCSLATATSNEAAITIHPLINNSVTIRSSAVNNTSSPNQTVVFTAQASYNTNIAYQWQVNNINAGTNSPEFTADNLVNGDVITCLVTTTGQCIATQVVTSNAITMIIYVPIVVVNTFTPNGDGINDTWDIPMLRTYPNCRVSVFSRYGNSVYNSVGYAKPWDGTYKQKQVPTGTYYYIIDLKNGRDKVSGSVTVIR
ncbi:gliding motility-associated C-terminal domain-containing protein [Mucilaginibacter flavidus]|uniref:T9SS type B sorting domain-containing protein n=1 Tax=Mucilaginibacter flavidus TaxID=2949309 RepID=UPI0020939BB5|nr:gliding motility-associated C-terminal domain-containing protein [Mucilaginibacter flavidus]